MTPWQDVLSITKRLSTDEFSGRIDPLDVLAFVQIESSFDEHAFRYETKLGQASYGLMQLLLSTAVDRGFKGKPEDLFEPETNIRLGSRQIIWIGDFLGRHAVHPLDPDNLAGAYNAGVGNVLHGFYSKHYVAAFRNARADFERKLAGGSVTTS